ncbi:MAG: hypothetical protein Q8M22_01770 [Actinomycetota bacterium]|nr:hypothetical protein [Actinomycetota bacterium]
MYLFNRGRVAHPDHFTDAVAWAVDIAGKASSVAGVQVEAWASVLSPDAGTIVWTAVFDTLTDCEAAMDKLGADSAYNAAVTSGAPLFTGTVTDGLLNLITGPTGTEPDYAYVASVQAVAANGQIAAAMQHGVAIAAAATATGGLTTMFGAEVTGPYGGVRWLTGAPSIAALEASMVAVNSDPAFVALVDGGGGVFQPGAQQLLFRRIG